MFSTGSYATLLLVTRMSLMLRPHIPCASDGDPLRAPEAGSLGAYLTTSEQIREFHARAKIAAEEFKGYYKDATGKEPRPELLVSPAQEKLLNAWLATAEGMQKIAALSERVISFVTDTVSRGHPGHDMRHVLYKDPISGLRIALEEDLSPTQQLFIIPSLLHDAGRLFEPELFDTPQSGTVGVDHTILGFAITKELLCDSLASESQDLDLAIALRNLHNEILNAVLDHQSGDSRSSLMSQYVQRADREQLVGYESLHRFISFDMGFYPVEAKECLKPEWREQLPLPGARDDTNLLVHAEFYARNLYENGGSIASQHADEGKIQTGRFLMLAATPRMREQIFYPELQRAGGSEIPPHWSKRPLSPEIWREIESFTSSELESRLDRIRGGRTLQELADTFIHPPHATRTDSGNYTNWKTIVTKLTALSTHENRRFGRALTYGLLLAEEIDATDRATVAEALYRFRQEPTSLVYKVARLVSALQEKLRH